LASAKTPTTLCVSQSVMTRPAAALWQVPAYRTSHRWAGALGQIPVRQRTIRGQRGGRAALMRINIWIVLAVLLALLAITRLLQYQHETQRNCADDPSASVCGR
jgi:hypothetical protein